VPARDAEADNWGSFAGVGGDPFLAKASIKSENCNQLLGGAGSWLVWLWYLLFARTQCSVQSPLLHLYIFHVGSTRRRQLMYWKSKRKLHLNLILVTHTPTAAISSSIQFCAQRKRRALIQG
ncbi:unnamed protein product, partial [Heterosigma akashiwo]